MEKYAQENLKQENIVVRFVIAVVVLLLVFAALSNKTYVPRAEVQGQISQADQSAQEAKVAAELVSRLGKLVELPNEQPQIAVVQDPQKISPTQTFLANSEKGDVIFAYSDRVILFRPLTNKIINIGPASVIASNQPAPVIEKTQIEVRNASGKAGAVSEWTSKVTLPEQFAIGSTGNATSKAIAKPLVVFMDPALDTLDNRALFEGLVPGADYSTTLPVGEKASDSKIVIFLK